MRGGEGGTWRPGECLQGVKSARRNGVNQESRLKRSNDFKSSTPTGFAFHSAELSHDLGPCDFDICGLCWPSLLESGMISIPDIGDIFAIGKVSPIKTRS